MELDKISDDTYISFCALMSGKKLTQTNCRVERTKKEVKVFLPRLELGFEQELEKVFRFKENFCRYEYGCIRLDFSSDWKNYISSDYEQ